MGWGLLCLMGAMRRPCMTFHVSSELLGRGVVAVPWVIGWPLFPPYTLSSEACQSQAGLLPCLCDRCRPYSACQPPNGIKSSKACSVAATSPRRHALLRNACPRGKKIALDLARGLEFMHQRKLIHFDIKSLNVLLTADGTAKLADVGLAKVRECDC